MKLEFLRIKKKLLWIIKNGYGNKSFIFYFLIFFSNSYINAQSIDNSISTLQKIVNAEKYYHGSKVELKTFAFTSDYDVNYYRCQWQVDPAVTYISGVIAIYFKPLTSDFNSIQFDLTDSLTVDSIKYNNILVSFNHLNNSIAVQLPLIIPIHSLDSLSIYYQGRPPQSGLGAFVQSKHANQPIIWTLSEPYGASDWWPCKNNLTDKADSIDIIITTSSKYKVASNGLLVSVKSIDQNKIFHWKHCYPIATYLICFAVTNYAEYTHLVNLGDINVPIQNYIYPEDSAQTVKEVTYISSMIKLYSDLFGIYPFKNEKYGHAQIGWGGGMEHQTITFVNKFDYGLLAHELVHHWFGDKITCASWEDVWLNEGFARYFEGVAYERLMKSYWNNFKIEQINEITKFSDGSVWCDDTTNIGRIFDLRLSYSKGAMILHQLRWIMGDSAFFLALRNYINDLKLSYGFAHTSDFKLHLENVVGKSLTWYFDDWYKGQGYPSYQITWTQTMDTVAITINQKRSHSSVSFFELPLPLVLQGELRDTTIRLDHTFSGQVFSIKVPFKIKSIVFDPEHWLISKNNTVTELKKQVSFKEVVLYPNPVNDQLYIALGNRFLNSGKLIQVTGKIMKEFIGNGTEDVLLDLNNIAKGVYILQLNVDNDLIIEKIIVQ